MKVKCGFFFWFWQTQWGTFQNFDDNVHLLQAANYKKNIQTSSSEQVLQRGEVVVFHQACAASVFIA